MNDEQMEAVQAEALRLRRPQNRLQQYAKATPKASKYVPLALKLQAQSVSDANEQKYTQAFDPVFSPEGVLVTPQQSTPDAAELYLNAAAAALSEVQKYDESAAKVLLKIIDFFASNARFGAPDYQSLMCEREAGWRLAEQKQREIQALELKIKQFKYDISSSKKSEQDAQAEAFASQFAQNGLLARIEDLEREIEGKNEQISQLSRDAEEHQQIRTQQLNQQNEIFKDAQQLRTTYEEQLVEAIGAKERFEAAKQHQETLQDQICEISAQAHDLARQLEDKQAQLESSQTENQELQQVIAEQRAEFDQLLAQLRGNSLTEESEMVKELINRPAVREFGGINETNLQTGNSHRFPGGQLSNSMLKQAREQYDTQSSTAGTKDVGIQCQIETLLTQQSKGSQLSVNENLQPRPSQAGSSSQIGLNQTLNSQNFAEDDLESVLESTDISDEESSGSNTSLEGDYKNSVYFKRYRKYRRMYQKVKHQLQFAYEPNYPSNTSEYAKGLSGNHANSAEQLAVKAEYTGISTSEVKSNTTSKAKMQVQPSFTVTIDHSNEKPEHGSSVKIEFPNGSRHELKTAFANVNEEEDEGGNGAALKPEEEKIASQANPKQSSEITEKIFLSDNVQYGTEQTNDLLYSDDAVVTPAFGISDEEFSAGEKLREVLGPNGFISANGAYELILDKKRGRQLLLKIEASIEASSRLIHNIKHELDISEQIQSSAKGQFTDLDSLLNEQLQGELFELRDKEDGLYNDYMQTSENLTEIYSWLALSHASSRLSTGRAMAINGSSHATYTETEAEAANQQCKDLEKSPTKSVIREFNIVSPGTSTVAENVEYNERELFSDGAGFNYHDSVVKEHSENDVYIKQELAAERATSLLKFPSNDFEARRQAMIQAIEFMRRSKTLSELDLKVVIESFEHQLNDISPVHNHKPLKTELLRLTNQIEIAKSHVHSGKSKFKHVLWVRDHVFQAEKLIRLKAEADLESEIIDARFKFLTAEEVMRSESMNQEETVARESLLQTSLLPIYVKCYGEPQDAVTVERDSLINENAIINETNKYATEFTNSLDTIEALVSDEIVLSELSENTLIDETIKLHTGIRYFKKELLDRFLPLIEGNYCQKTFSIKCDKGYYLRLPETVYIKTLSFLLQTIRLARRQIDQKLPFPEAFLEWLERQYKIGDISRKLLFSVIVNAIFYAEENSEVKLFLIELNYGVRDYFVAQALRFMESQFEFNEQADISEIDSLKFSELFMEIFKKQQIICVNTFFEGVLHIVEHLSTSYEAFEESIMRIFELHQKNGKIDAESLRNILARIPIPFDAEYVETVATELESNVLTRYEFRSLISYLSLKDQDELAEKAAQMIKTTDLILMGRGPEWIDRFQTRRKQILRCIGLNNGAEAFVLCCDYCQDVLNEDEKPKSESEEG